MSLPAGTRLGAYEILGLIGAGGMGEVYRALDLRLNREVAVKVLTQIFASDPDRIARFQREAQVLASLNHPNIAHIHGLEHEGPVRALVLELVEGPTLADRIAQGPIPLEEALPISRQIVDALEAAHEHGIIHRDLKPANIKVRPDGTVKVLDFGLAKAVDPLPGSSDLSSSLTITSPAMTRMGVIMGTAAYMSPEQAKGKSLDKRSDIWAFGCVLYEELTGKRAFAGDDVTETIASVVRTEPDWGALPENVPPAIRRLLRRTLAKDRRERLGDIADARLELNDALIVPPEFAAAPGSAIPRTSPWSTAVRRGAWALSLGTLLVALAVWPAASRWLVGGRPPILSLARLMITLPAEQVLERGPFTSVAVSPDGKLLVYTAAIRGGPTQLYLRRLDELDARAIPAAAGANTPFFSPDGRWLAFYEGGALKRVSLAGGVPLMITEAPPVRSATWEGNTIVFATTLSSTGLWLVSADGGEPVQITTPKESEAQHAYPQILPGGTQVLFSVLGLNGWQPALLSLANREWRLIGQGRTIGEGAQYLPTGFLVYAQSGGLVAARFDPSSGELDATPIPLLERIETSRFGGAYFAIASSAGSLVYLPAISAPATRTLQRVDRDGRSGPMLDLRTAYEQPRVSPDGKRIAVTVASETGSDIWLIDLERGTRIRFTTDNASAFPVWSSDGSRLAYQSTASGPWNLYSKPVDRSTDAQPLLGSSIARPAVWSNAVGSLLPGTLPTLSGANPQFPMSWSADRSTLVFLERKPNGERDIWVVGPEGDPQPFLLTPFDERSPRLSPDGKWLAYVSNESGRDEVNVQPFPGPGPKWVIATDGSADPVWSNDGHELFYRQENKMMVVSIASTATFSASRPRTLFEGHFDSEDNGPNYDVSPDGKWFVMPRSEQAPAPAGLHVVLNWFSEITARTSADR